MARLNILRRTNHLPATRLMSTELLEDRRLLAVTTADLNTGLTPLDLAQALLGSGVEISNVTFQGSPVSAGTFQSGLSEGLGIDNGVMLSSGLISNVIGPNNSDFLGESLGQPGDSDLEGLVSEGNTFDAAVLEFDFIATAGTISFTYVFASEEYNEFVNEGFNDVFGFFLDGVNIALIPGSVTPVSIDTVNNGVNSQYYNDNDFDDFGGFPPFLTQADGFTVALKAVATVTPGVHHIKLAVADVGDPVLDSWVFLESNSFVAGESDMAISIVDSPSPAVVGGALTYTLNVTNNGPDPATNVHVENFVPANTTFLSASSSQGGTSFDAGLVTANLGSLASGATATVTIVVSADALGLVTNTATVFADQFEPNETNNSATIVTTVETPKLSIADVQIVEGNSGTKDMKFAVSLNGALLNQQVTVNYTTFDVTASAGSDYLPRGGTLVIPAGLAQAYIVVPVLGDIFNELTETFAIQLSSPVNAEILKGTATGTILNNDPLPNLYVNDPVVTTTVAGNYEAVFTVALDAPSGRQVQVAYSTANGGAIDGVDYLGVNGTLTFTPGVTTLQVAVPVTNTGTFFPNKKFYLNLLAPTNSLLVDGQGAATIVYDDDTDGEYIIDDGGAGYTKTAGWTNLTNTLAYQLDYDYAPAGNGSATATWNFVGIPNGSYQVFARWSHFGNRATNAPFTMLDNGLPVGTVLVNQQLAPTGEYSDGVYWQSLGFFSTTTNNFGVRLSNAANGYVVADAIRIVAGGIAAQTPEMDVSANEISIITGDGTPDLADGTHFGSVPVLADSNVQKFTIINNGNADLQLNGVPRVTIEGAHAGDFHIVTQPASLVAPGKKTTFEVQFHPLGAGLRTATISIANSDDSEHPYTFTVQGNGHIEALPLAHNAAFPQDVNDDGRVNSSDALTVINALLLKPSEPVAEPLAAGAAATPLAATGNTYIDVNADGRLNTSDLLMVFNYLLTKAALKATPQAAAVDEAIVLFDEVEEKTEAVVTQFEPPVRVVAAQKTIDQAPTLLLDAEELESLLSDEVEEAEELTAL